MRVFCLQQRVPAGEGQQFEGVVEGGFRVALHRHQLQRGAVVRVGTDEEDIVHLRLLQHGVGVLDEGEDGFPRFFHAGHHEGDDHGAVGVVAFDGFDFLQVHFQRAVGDEFDVVEAQKAAVGAPDGAVAGAVDVDDGGACFAKGFPDDTAPASLIRAADVVFLVRGRGGGQPEGVGGFDPGEFGGEIGHCAGLPVGA